MAKKKKTQLKPVARGFATTSVPKKVVEPVDSAEVSDAVEENAAPNGQPSAGDAPVPTAQILDETDMALQRLVEKYQDRTEREIGRTVKIIEQERRFSKTMQSLKLDAMFIDRVLELISETHISNDNAALDEPEDKLLQRLAITYGVLRRMGFSEERVQESLHSVSSVDLDDAIGWLALHCSEQELGYKKENIDDLPRKSLKTHLSSKGASTPPTPVIPDTPSKIISKLDANAPAFIPSFLSSDSVPTTPLDLGQLQSQSPPSDQEPGHTPSEDSTPMDSSISTYVSIKMQIDELTTHRQRHEPRDDAFLKGLRRRLEDIKTDYLFDDDEAEAAYRVERQRANMELLHLRLRGGDSQPVSAQRESHKQDKVHLSPTPTPPADTTPDIFDDSEDQPERGMLELLEALPTEEIGTNGSTIRVRDMTLPKRWSGRTPKTLLKETVHKSDRHAVITYKCISGSSRVKRAAVVISGDNGQPKEWMMEDVACHDLAQAEEYISTIALHSLTFPSLDGFALGGTGATNTATSFRVLPPIYRDLWTELEEDRKSADDATNRKIWSSLKTLLESKLRTATQDNVKEIRREFEISRGPFRRKVDANDLSSEQIKNGFNARQASPAYQEMLLHRNQLPIAAYRQEIINTLETSQVLVLSGETGCGKSTQLPAFILEDQLSRGKSCKIYVTEPRRISALSLANRVSIELGEPQGAVGTVGSVVGYSIRLESNISKTTRLAFVTNGIALRMLEGGSSSDGQGMAFDEVTHIIIDEVHERTIESDFLLIVLKSLLQQRPDLKVVLMSATVDADKIAAYFGGCPTLHVPGRTFPVDVRYLEDAVELTGWRVAEGSPYARRGNDKYNRNKGRTDWLEDTAPADDDEEDFDQLNVKLEKRYSPSTTSTLNLFDERLIAYELIIKLLERICLDDPDYVTYSSAILVFMPGMGEIRRLNDMLLEHPAFGIESQFRIHPLHSTISTEHQGAVFDIPPPGIRKIVISTNIAETGITIPDITCVVDSGKHREMRFDEKRQISRLVETYVARSNAAQRRGRAGRVQSGLCFHLFTKVRHDTKMAEHPDPEMMRLSLSDLALRIKIMKVNLGTSIEDVLNRALDPPLAVNIQRAISALVEVRALTTSEEITPMGRLLSKLPTDVHLGKFLLIATVFGCLDPALTIVATLNSKSPFLTPFGLADEAARAKLSFRTENSDFLTIHNAFSIWRKACANGAARKLCKQSFLSHQNLMQIEELRQQYLGYLVDSNFITVDRAFVRELSRARYNRGRPRFVSIPDGLDNNSNSPFLINAALAAGLYPKILAVDASKDEMRTIANNQPASFHPSSVNHGRKPKDFGTNHLCYFTLMQSKKLYAWETSPVEDMALLLLCGEAEFKLMSDTVIIDRKIKFRLEPKVGIALKFLREHLSQLLAAQFSGLPLTESKIMWNELAMMVLGKVKIKDREDREETVTLVINK